MLTLNTKEVKNFVDNVFSKGWELEVVAIIIFEDLDNDNKYYVDAKIVYNNGEFEYFTCYLEDEFLTLSEAQQVAKDFTKELISLGVDEEEYIYLELEPISNED